MLHIFFGEMPEAILNVEVYFQNVYEGSWLVDAFAREVIHRVDHSKVLGTPLIFNPAIGLIFPELLSGGTKTLLLIKNMPEQVFSVSACGDDCARFILKLAMKRDVIINLRHLMNFGKRLFKAVVLNDGTMVSGMEELLFEAIKYI